jgi:hypothetical protein
LNQYKNRLNRFWPSRRQSARSLRYQLRSLRCQFRSLRCQKFRAVNTFFCALLLRSLTRNRLNRFLNRLNRFSVFWPADSPFYFSPSLLFSSSLFHFPATAAHSSSSLSFTLHSKNSLVPSHLWKSCWRSVHLGVLHHLPQSRWDFLTKSPDRGIALFHFLVLDPTRS